MKKISVVNRSIISCIFIQVNSQDELFIKVKQYRSDYLFCNNELK